jgi:hypothetical protein
VNQNNTVAVSDVCGDSVAVLTDVPLFPSPNLYPNSVPRTSDCVRVSYIEVI